MRRLARIRKVGRTIADVDAGVTWREVLDATLPRGIAPPALTDYQDLSVGGTLSVGGIGGAGFRHGAQVDNVLALEVVTGRGQLTRCSRTRQSRLFDAMLAGLGQCGVITRAIIRLRPAPAEVRLFDLLYVDLATFAADPAASFGWPLRHGPGPRRPEPRRRLGVSARSHELVGADRRGVARRAARRPQPGGGRAHAVRGVRHATRPDRRRATGVGRPGAPHPWFDAWLPDSRAEAFAGRRAVAADPPRTGGGPILLYPTRPSAGQAAAASPSPPASSCGSSTSCAPRPATTKTAAQMVADNRRLLRATAPPGSAATSIPSDRPPRAGGVGGALRRRLARVRPGQAPLLSAAHPRSGPGDLHAARAPVGATRGLGRWLPGLVGDARQGWQSGEGVLKNASTCGTCSADPAVPTPASAALRGYPVALSDEPTMSRMILVRSKSFGV